MNSSTNHCLNICLVTHILSKGNGQGRVNYEIVKSAINSGHRVTVIASYVASELAQHPSVSVVEISVKRYPTELLRNLIFATMSYLWLRNNSRQFDIIHVNGFITWFSADINTSHFVHSSWLRSPVHTRHIRKDLYGFYQGVYTRLNARLERYAYRKKSKRVVAVSRSVREQLEEISVPGSKLSVVINGVDLSEFHPGHCRREELGLPIGVPLGLFAGDISSPRKNLDTVLQSMTQVEHLELVVLGNTTKSPYPKLAKQLGVWERVHFLEYRSDIPDLMRSVDIFIFPSRYEACSLVLLEALASGLPAVTASTTGGSEIVTPECGYVLADPNDIDALAHCLNKLVADPERRREMGLAARNVAEHFGWDQMAANYLNLYQAVQQSR